MTDALREANGGRRVDVVLDMTGGRITDESVAALAPFGRLAFYGMANRHAAHAAAARRACWRTRPPSPACGWCTPCACPACSPVRWPTCSQLVEAGTLRAVAGGDYPLSQARRAHEDLRARRTVGKLVLNPAL